ncbi:ornithine cyclodeaminase [Sinosporangium album]|uniref:Ornithine cyclodeaminase n=1 Tax=Sinosporangium album TaxID=504805 RepID=A0A1G7ZUK1_9ACTN|nr:hypothetical protein [Sinosporangium album]SDH12359.1 ornithine cyclodeaminase [Sinosporangium album]
MTLLLTRDEVRQVMDLPTAVQVLIEAADAHAAGNVDALPPAMLAMESRGLRMVSGAVGAPKRMGVRVGPAGRFTTATLPVTANLYNEADGQLLASMAYPFGPLRIAATLAIATRTMARPDAASIGLIGSGSNAALTLSAIVAERSIKEVRIFSRAEAGRTAFAEKVSAELGVSVVPVSSVAHATEGAEIVLVGTPSIEPVLHADHVTGEGALVLSYGRPSEVDHSVHLAADRVVVGSKLHEQGWYDAWRRNDGSHPLMRLAEEDRLGWDAVQELGDITSGRIPSRTSDQELIVFKDSEGGFWDIAIASAVYERARARGLGTEFDFG